MTPISQGEQKLTIDSFTDQGLRVFSQQSQSQFMKTHRLPYDLIGFHLNRIHPDVLGTRAVTLS